LIRDSLSNFISRPPESSVLYNAQIVDSSSRNAVNFSSARATRRFPAALARRTFSFSPLTHQLLFGNFGNGRINAFDLNTGAFLGRLSKRDGQPLGFDGLWGLFFIDKRLYFTAGIADEAHGLFGVIKANP
jgi:hypothetical protein